MLAQILHRGYGFIQASAFSSPSRLSLPPTELFSSDVRTSGTLKVTAIVTRNFIRRSISQRLQAISEPAAMSISVDDAKNLICELCRLFYDQGWVSGTGGGISVKAGSEIVMAPSGVQKERMQPDDMFVLDSKGEIIHTPAAKPPPNRPPKLSECSPLFMAAYELRNAGAVIHSHSINAVLATMLDPEASEFVITHVEMIKGIEGHGFYGKCVVPVIENTARECELTDRLRQAIADYPQANAVLVRRHGVYVWGKDWIQAKTQAECYDYLFEAAVRMNAMGLDYRRPPAPIFANGNRAAAVANGASDLVASFPAQKKLKIKHSAALPTCIVLDIEGTVAPISFVADVMFPYAKQHCRAFLEGSYDSAETQADIQLIREQAAADVAAGEPGVGDVPPASADKPTVVNAVVAWVDSAILADRKVTALKTLQGHIWRSGFTSGAMRSELFRDVPDALVEWRSAGIKTYIYSSGSREAQRLFFGYSQVGDLRPYLCGFFDTTSGAKVQSTSYSNIALSLGTDSPDDILFATDSLAEAQAATVAGWRAVLVERPGNKALPEGHGFRVISSMQELL
ncbi:hypothetical protein Vretimale_5328 [Volvox reticuliferus]|uniref:Probable bifunctional methylthioribulose-1-phosphate dehydratase/enolase-phosphatase E1 n=1 Tax=Volvox reticuliferus TaxID=1737510 RepID=A0A8J4C3E8_9CHLO|nr:hypothetical protein Vretifemale_3912 [Volvox reticuliferus]GIM00156.1 hypothetical protein Vretimale_5328 [Volvox reticuliferus]